MRLLIVGLIALMVGAYGLVSCAPNLDGTNGGADADTGGGDGDGDVDGDGDSDRDSDLPPVPTCDPPCGEGETCVDEHCEACAHEICGGRCCEDGELCSDDRCCRPDCTGRECGDDGCGGSCGECSGGGAACSPSGQCCVTNCDGRVCGGDGCGGSCGACGAEEFCVDEGRSCAADAGGYDNASPAVHFLEPVVNLVGPYDVATGGGHLLASNASGGTNWPRETQLSSTDTVNIPEGATVRYAFIWVAGFIFMRPHDEGQGDYTDDRGAQLDSFEDMQANGASFSIDGESFGPFDTSSRTPPGQTSIGSQSQLSPMHFDPEWGTLTGTKVTGWANRLDVTSLMAGRTGEVSITVDPPERLDINGNDAGHNGGNPAGSSVYNSCTGGASWSVMVVYELPGAPQQNVILMDGDWLRAWDYMFFHTGRWQRPALQIDHMPIRPGARFIAYSGSGSPAGATLPAFPTCTCGCGGTYTLTRSGFMTNAFFSNQHVDPEACGDDPMHRDRTNGPWYLGSGGLTTPIFGNDWTLFQSGDILTEFPNLYEGHETPSADGIETVTNESETNAGRDTYRGHPWAGRGEVTYHAAGNMISVVEVEPDPSAIDEGSTTSYLYFRGDQKDVWKPQQAILIKWVLFITPID